MRVDFFLGKRDKAIVKEAKALGFDRVVFVKEASTMAEIKKEKDYDAILLKASSAELLRRMVDRASNLFFFILVLGINDQINRTALENKKVTALLSPEYERSHDWVNYRSSGLNQVLCKIARDNNKAIIINFKDILAKKEEGRAVLLGRIAQNIGLCRKYGVKLRIASFASKLEELRDAASLKALGFALGMNTAQAASVLAPC